MVRSFLTEQDRLSTREILDLTRVVGVLDETLGDYQKRVDEIVAEARAKIERNGSDDVVRLANVEANKQIRELDDEQGDDELTLALDRRDYQYVKAHWDKDRTWTGDDTSRKLVAALYAVFEGKPREE